MAGRPPRSTLTVTLFPYTTLVRSLSVAAAGESANAPHAPVVLDRHSALGANDCISLGSDRRMTEAITPVLRNRCDYAVSVSYFVADDGAAVRACDTGSSEERRVGKECVSTVRSRWSPCH